MKWRTLSFAAVIATACLHASPAFADDDDAPEDPLPAPPPASPPPPPAPPAPPPPAGRTEPIAETPYAPPVPSDAKTLFEQLARPPGQPVPVPNPSPVVLGGVPTPPGEAATPLVWNRARFSKADFAIMVAGSALTLGAAIVSPGSKHAIGPVLFDRQVLNTIRASSVQTRYEFRDGSDVGLSLAATWPFVVDAFVTAWWYRGSRDVAEQMALLGLETLAVSGAVQGVANVLVSRERPYGPTCGTALPSNAQDCVGSTHYRSFFSGHAAFSFTAASLICFEHMQLDLLGGPWDALSCAGGYAVAAATATFRVAGNEHYPSDVITGALIGSAIGWGVPLLHFKHPNVGTLKTSGGLTMRIVPQGTGAGVVGTF